MRGRTTAGVVIALLLVGALAPAAGGAGPAGTTTQENCSFPVTYTDATGTEVTVDEAPEEVVVIAPSAAQTMWDIGARGQVVGMPVGPTTAYLEGSSDRENIWTDDSQVNQEKVVGMEPDLVLAANINRNETVESLRDAGLTVYKAGFGGSLESIHRKVERFGAMTGHCEGAAATVDHMRDRAATVRDAVEGQQRPRVLYYFFNFTAGSGTFVNSLIETAGGQNIAAEAGVTGYARVNPELVADRNPEWIVHQSASPLPSRAPYNGTTAIQENQTLAVSANLISQPGPRVIQPMTKMAQAWHPEAYAAANATTPTPTPSDAPSPTASPTASPTDTSGGSGPGFGVVAALVAAGLALLASRR